MSSGYICSLKRHTLTALIGATSSTKVKRIRIVQMPAMASVVSWHWWESKASSSSLLSVRRRRGGLVVVGRHDEYERRGKGETCTNNASFPRRHSSTKLIQCPESVIIGSITNTFYPLYYILNALAQHKFSLSPSVYLPASLMNPHRRHL